MFVAEPVNATSHVIINIRRRTTFPFLEKKVITNSLLSVKDIENTLKLGHTKTAELIARGEIKTFKIGRRRLTTADLLQGFIDQKIEEQAA